MRLIAAVVVLVLTAGCSQQSAQSPTPNVSPSARPSVTTVASPSPSPPLASPTAATVTAGSFKLTRVASGLKSPVFITGAGDGSGRLFIVEQPGRILVMKNGQVLPTPFLDIRSKIAFGGERGLLGLAFHPDFALNGVFVVDYTRSTGHVGDTIIARYRAVPGSDVADPSSAQILLTISQPQANHNGGMVTFGPDRYLYIGMGDGGNGGDVGAGHAPQGNGQSVTTLLGKLLRVDVGATGGYSIPPTNPKISSSALGAIWAYGLRNPWRFSFDRATGALYIADVGQDAWEEVDVRAPEDRGGENYGWPVFEGTHTYRAGVRLTGDVKPVAQYDHSSGDCSVSGGYVYRGQKIPSMFGFYVFGDYCSGRVRTLVNFQGHWRMSVLLDTSYLISSFGQDDAGELYLVSLGGQVYRFDPSRGISGPIVRPVT
jgi:glucose/arabinose dehydrogenase